MNNNLEIYWNHNTAYHKWILSQINNQDRVLDVGCGEGLLVYKLASECKEVVGIDTHLPSIKKAKQRTFSYNNVSIKSVSFEDFDEKENSFDTIIFVASIHHMDLNICIDKSKKLLKPGGKLLIVGLAHPSTFFDKIIEICRFIPVKVGDLFHDVKGDVGAPIIDEKESLTDIRLMIKNKLPNAIIKQALYYRYLLMWIKS